MTVKRWIVAACLAAISYLLMFLSFVIVPIVPFMKLDFSSFLHFGTIRWATGRIFTLLVVFYDLRTVITAIDRSQPEFCGYVSVLFTTLLFA